MSIENVVLSGKDKQYRFVDFAKISAYRRFDLVYAREAYHESVLWLLVGHAEDHRGVYGGG
mgnify:CR=1 FL=1